MRSRGSSALLLLVAVAVIALAGVAYVRVTRLDRSAEPAVTVTADKPINSTADLTEAEKEMNAVNLETTQDEQQLEADFASF